MAMKTQQSHARRMLQCPSNAPRRLPGESWRVSICNSLLVVIALAYLVSAGGSYGCEIEANPFGQHRRIDRARSPRGKVGQCNQSRSGWGAEAAGTFTLGIR